MAGFKSRILFGIMRHRHLFKGRLKKDVLNHDIDSVLAFRAECEKGAARFGKLPQGVVIRQELINMVISEWIVPENAPENKLIFYVHGGGYVSGSCNDHRILVAKIALRARIKVLLYEYGLAPENPFPAALNDSVNVYRSVLERGYNPDNIIVMGESAGGGLGLALLLALKDKHIPLPKAAVAVQPWTDLSCSGDSYQTKNKVSLAPLNCWNVFSHYYVAKNDVRNPYISPLFGNLEGLPPVYINVGDHDELYDDSIQFYSKAKQAGVDATLYVGKGMIHCFPLLAPLFKEATEAMNNMILYIRTKLSE